MRFLPSIILALLAAPPASANKASRPAAPLRAAIVPARALPVFARAGFPVFDAALSLAPEAPEDSVFAIAAEGAALAPSSPKAGSLATLIPREEGRPPREVALTAELAAVLRAHLDRGDAGSAYAVLRRFDGTTRFDGLVADALAAPSAALPAEASGARWLLVRGFLGNHIEDYMRANLDTLRGAGLDARFVDIATEGGRAKGLAAIRRAVEDSPRPVVLVGHSRGGNHVHDAYRSWPEELKSKVLHNVLIQAPLAGSPVADWFLKRRLATWLARLRGQMPLRGPIRETLKELSTPSRAAILAALPALTAADLAKTLVVYSAFRHGVNEVYHKDMAAFRSLISVIANEPSDGLVPVASALLPGAREVYLPDVDHEDLVLQRPGWFKRLVGSAPHPGYPPAAFMQALARRLFGPGAD